MLSHKSLCLGFSSTFAQNGLALSTFGVVGTASNSVPGDYYLVNWTFTFLDFLPEEMVVAPYRIRLRMSKNVDRS